MSTLSLLSPRRRTDGSRKDYTVWYIAAAATVLSVTAYVITERLDAVLAYGDAVSHLEIARRVIYGTSPGLAQLGGVWPPLPHMLTALFAWIDPLYYNGFAGSIVSMAAFVATVVLVYLIVWRLTESQLAGVVGASVIGLSTNMLYMQSLPMTEALLLCMLAATVYSAQRWIETDRVRYLVHTGLAALLATLSRYESWPYVVVLLAGLALIAWWRRLPMSASLLRGDPGKLRRARARDRIVYLGLPTLAGILGWMLWNQVIFGDALNFQTGDYAKPALWLSDNEPAIGNWSVALQTYVYAIGGNLTWPVVTLAIAGMVFMAWFAATDRSLRARTLPTWSLLAILVFYVIALYQGQRPLHVAQITGDLYNVRFGLVALLPAAIFIGYLAGVVRRRFPAGVPIVAAVVMFIVATAGSLTLTDRDVTTFREAEGSTSPFQLQVAASLEQQYDGGLVLMESFGNERLAHRAIPTQQLVYEGSYRQWRPALRSPSANGIVWIVTRCGAHADQVCTTVNQGEFARYNLVSEMADSGTGDVYRFYRRP